MKINKGIQNIDIFLFNHQSSSAPVPTAFGSSFV